MARRSSLSRDVLPEEIETDICIIGGGVAGQSLAIKLAEFGHDSLILESGEADFKADIQALAQGPNLGEDYYPLDHARLRLFGGTAAIWGGRCAELDPIDFEKRDFLPHSGWPITKADLDPFYDEAFASLGLERPGEGRLAPKIGWQPPAFDPEKLDADLWVFDENGERFTDQNRKGLETTDIILGATITQIDVGDQGQVEAVVAQSLNGRTLTVKARIFVMAAGAIASVRLLMGAVPNRPNGLGNDQDQLGRFFMEHPHARGGEIIPNKLSEGLLVLPRALRVAGKRYAAYMRPSPVLQREKGLLNSSISFAVRRREGENAEMHRRMLDGLKHDLPSTRLWRSLYKGAKGLAIRGLELSDPWFSVAMMNMARGRTGLFALVRAEQAPNPDSRVVLGDEHDALGIRHAALDWHLSPIDRLSVKGLMEALRDEYRRLGWGDITVSKWLSDESLNWKTDPLISAHPIGGYHHMGGVRMSETNKTGVVDSNCRLFESPNLYVAGSSVFPTGGWANPTVTIMSLALRLGAHLGQKRLR